MQTRDVLKAEYSMKLINTKNYILDCLRARRNNNLYLALFDQNIPEDLAGFKTAFDMFTKSKYIYGKSLSTNEKNCKIGDNLELDFGSGTSNSVILKQCINASGAQIDFPDDFYVYTFSGFNESQGIPTTRPDRFLSSTPTRGNLFNQAVLQGSLENYANHIYAGYANRDNNYTAPWSRRLDLGAVKPIDFVYFRGSDQDLKRLIIDLWYIPTGQTGWVRIRNQITASVQGRRYLMLTFPRINARDLAVTLRPENGLGAAAWNLYIASTGFGVLERPVFNTAVMFTVDDTNINNIEYYEILNPLKLNYVKGCFKLKVDVIP